MQKLNPNKYPSKTLVKVYHDGILVETEKAIGLLFKIDMDGIFCVRTHYVPKSQIDKIGDDFVIVPLWLAENSSILMKRMEIILKPVKNLKIDEKKKAILEAPITKRKIDLD